MAFVRIYSRIKSVAERILMGDGLRAKVMRGGVGLATGSTAEQASRFVRNMVLTRLLAPDALGTMAIVLSASSIMNAFTDVGVRSALIQNPRGAEDRYLNSAWWLGMSRAILMYAIIFGASPWVSNFYRQPELSALLRVALLGAVLEGAMSPRSALPQKQMKLWRWAVISNGGAICGVILTLLLSVFIRNVWALALGYCSENAFRCILSYALCPGLPSIRLDRQAVRDLLKFSRGIFGLSFLNLIFARADVFVLGKLYSVKTLGLYTMAVSLIQTPTGFIIALLMGTLLPALSHVQEDVERINRIVIEVSSWIILLGLPAAVALWLCGPSFLTLAYGSRYAAYSGAMVVAAGVMFLNTLNSVVTGVFYARGCPGLHRRAVAASAIMILITIYPACKLLGPVGAQGAALLAIFVSYFLQVLRMRGLTGLNVLRYGRPFVPAAAISAAIIGIGICARLLGIATSPNTNLALGIGVCAVAYALSVPTLLRMTEIG
jgi:O-antigen/teichoic acid export membrane protein